MNRKKRYLIVMIISVVFNTFFYLIAHFFHLPVWLDLQGTAFAAIVLEPAAGLLVGLANNFISSIFFYDASSLIYYAVSAVVALIAGIMLKKDGKISAKRIIPTLICVILAASFVSAILTMWRSGGLPNSKWELYFYQIAMNHNVPALFSVFFGAAVLKAGDAIISLFLMTGLYWLLPKSLRYDEAVLKQNEINRK